MRLPELVAVFINKVWSPCVGEPSELIATSWSAKGKKVYELINHMGMVLAIISDKRVDSI
ncbi:hypothetical protein SAMN05216311_108219 [Chitinophaga sp. CF418]|nr:hypothetical protein SAMN05216311_108219 [Chitinophaga sp. CF418]